MKKHLKSIVLLMLLVMVVASCTLDSALVANENVEGKSETNLTVATKGNASVSIYSATSITSTSAIVTGNVSSSDTVWSTGICFSTSPNPTVSSSTYFAHPGAGAISCTLTGLSPQTKYYARAFAITTIGPEYSYNS